MSYQKYINEWNRKLPKPPKDFKYQVFVNAKTRNIRPFYFLSWQKKGQLIHYDASVICIYLNETKENVKKIVSLLNGNDWESMGLLRNGRYHFTQSILKGVLTNGK